MHSSTKLRVEFSPERKTTSSFVDIGEQRPQKRSRPPRLFFACALALLGCAPRIYSPDDAPFVRAHSIFVDRVGAPVRVEDLQSEGLQEWNLWPLEYRAQLHALRDSIERSGRDTLLIFVHGGLVKLSSGMERASVLAREISEKSPGIYPVVVNWSSEGASAYWNQITRVKAGLYKANPGVISKGIGVVVNVPSDLLTGLVNVPRTELRRLAEGKRASDAPRPPNDSTLDADSIRVSIGKYRRPRANRYVSNVAAFLTTPFKVVITDPILFGLGTKAYENMERSILVTLRPYEEYGRCPGTPFGRADDKPCGYSRPSGALAVLLDTIAAMTKGGRKPHHVVLIGHSMGAIVANEILRGWPEIPWSDVVYMAAASTVRDAVDAVTPVLRKDSSTRFYNLTLHPYAERDEKHFGYFIPRGSLLQWIDGAFSSPRTPGDRVIGRFDNALMSLQLFPNDVRIRSRVYLKAFGYRDTSDLSVRDWLEPIQHGDFSSGKTGFWRREFWTPKTDSLTNVIRNNLPPD